MGRAWTVIDAAATPEGALELRQRGDDFLIVVGGRVLMSSAAHRTEVAVAEVACTGLTGSPKVLIGGLGMGYTLRAALDALPATAAVTVAELNPVIERWCHGPLAPLTSGAVDDPRVTLKIADVARLIATTRGWDAIVLDLYEGPHAATQSADDPFYGARALRATHAALVAGGKFAVWSEDPDFAFEKRLATAGFTVTRAPARGGPRHAVYLATRR
jgi:spermidine synthase